MYIKLSRNSSAEYYQENKERLQKKLIKDSKIFLEKKEKNGCEHYKNLSEDEKEKLGEYRKKYCRMRKNALS